MSKQNVNFPSIICEKLVKGSIIILKYLFSYFDHGKKEMKTII